jgi:hypothetical protein
MATKVVNRARIDITQTAENEPSRRGGDLSVNFFIAASVSAWQAGSGMQLQDFREHDGGRQL